MLTTLSPKNWHQRFVQQARWTRDLRAFLFPQAGLESAQRILDLGCGTGALLGELTSQTDGLVFGLDIQYKHLGLALENKQTLLTQGDAHQLPYLDNTFDICLCHFLLLWVQNPAQVLREMLRVTAPGGVVLALAEPDYGGRIDYPPELEILGDWQTEALQHQGADPHMGRKLAGLFAAVGLQDITSGVLGGQWNGAPSPDELALEWAVLGADLEETLRDFESLRALDTKAWEDGERVLFVPTFYALGRVEKSLQYPLTDTILP